MGLAVLIRIMQVCAGVVEEEAGGCYEGLANTEGVGVPGFPFSWGQARSGENFVYIFHPSWEFDNALNIFECSKFSFLFSKVDFYAVYSCIWD